ncbi:MAG: zinc protease [Myxococcota bacterium]|jgi:zinc protease
MVPTGFLLMTVSTALAQATPDIPFEKYELANGLDVILAEDHSVPFVQVNIWYNVGSKDEVAGRTGFAHLFEHLMFQGSQHNDEEYFQLLEQVGGQINGTTSFDRTNYFEGVPAEHLPLALWVESDRMGWLLPALTQEKLDNQKEVVRNERRQRVENTPYGEAWMWMFEGLYPEGHPYHTPTIGRHEDIEAATLDDVTAFFATWYVPNNASLVISGDFDPAVARDLVEKYFGEIPAGTQPSPVTDAPASLSEERVIRKEDEVPTPKVWVAWLTPKVYAPGDAEMDILASLLSDGKDSRLYRHLVRDTKVAKDIVAFQYSTRLQGQFIINATAAEGHTTDELVAEIDKVLATLRAEGPTAEEVSIAQTNYIASFYDGLQSISAKADRLNSYNTMVGDPGHIGADLARYRALTSASVANAATRWLPADRRVVLHITPATETDGGDQ